MEESIRVAVRVRPFNDREIELKSALIVSMSGPTTTIATDQGPKTFTYDYSYFSVYPDEPSSATQDKVYDDIGTVLLRNGCDGFNSCLFAYGQTGAGKSFSVMGTMNQPGIIPRIVDETFKEKSIAESSGRAEMRIWITFVEIYNEQLRDLLSASGKHDSEDLHIVDHPHFGVCVPGVTESPCKEAVDVQKLMDFGTKKRVVASTCMNATSSRSHAVFTIKVQRFDGPPSTSGDTGDRKGLEARINLVDLAGSERQSKTGATGQTLKEGCAINQSLSALGMVIKELSESTVKSHGRAKGGAKGSTASKKPNVPFRASKLTFLLKDSLAGNSKTFMIAALSPAKDNELETLSTLRFAASVKQIKTVAKKNISKSDEVIAGLQDEIKKLKAQLEHSGLSEDDQGQSELEKELKSHQQLHEKMTRSFEDHLDEHVRMSEARAEVLRDLGLLEADNTDDAVGHTTPYLLNVSVDPLLSGSLIYFVKSGVATTIGADSDNVIVLRGLGMEPHHCCITNVGDRQVSLEAMVLEGTMPRIKVNGRTLLQAAQPLRHNDRIVFGRAFAVRLNVPLASNSPKNRAPAGSASVMDCMKEMHLEESDCFLELSSYLQDLYDKLDDDKRRSFQTTIHEACHLVDEANDITQEVRPSDALKFEIEFVWDIFRETTDDIIVIRLLQFETANTTSIWYYWGFDKFKDRLEKMRDVYHQYHSSGKWDNKDIFNDPWKEPTTDDVKFAIQRERESAIQRAKSQWGEVRSVSMKKPSQRKTPSTDGSSAASSATPSRLPPRVSSRGANRANGKEVKNGPKAALPAYSECSDDADLQSRRQYENRLRDESRLREQKDSEIAHLKEMVDMLTQQLDDKNDLMATMKEQLQLVSNLQLVTSTGHPIPAPPVGSPRASGDDGRLPIPPVGSPRASGDGSVASLHTGHGHIEERRCEVMTPLVMTPSRGMVRGPNPMTRRIIHAAPVHVEPWAVQQPYVIRHSSTPNPNVPHSNSPSRVERFRSTSPCPMVTPIGTPLAPSASVEVIRMASPEKIVAPIGTPLGPSASVEVIRMASPKMSPRGCPQNWSPNGADGVQVPLPSPRLNPAPTVHVPGQASPFLPSPSPPWAYHQSEASWSSPRSPSQPYSPASQPSREQRPSAFGMQSQAPTTIPHHVVGGMLSPRGFAGAIGNRRMQAPIWAHPPSRSSR